MTPPRQTLQTQDAAREFARAGARADTADTGAGVEAGAVGDLPMRTYRYRLTRDDVAAFWRLPRVLMGRDRLFLLGPALVGGLLFGTFEKELRHLAPSVFGAWWSFPLGILALIAFAYGMSALMLTVRTWWRIRRAHVPASETVVDTWWDHFAITEDGRTRHFAWEMVSVVEDDGHVFLCPSAREAIILPLRAFESSDAMRAFADFAELAGGDPDDDNDDNDEGTAEPAATAQETRSGHDTKGARA